MLHYQVLRGLWVNSQLSLPASKLIYIALLSALTLIIGAAYTLWMIKRVIFGAVTNEKINSQSDMNLIEAIPLGLIALLILLIGVWPKPLTDMMNSTILALSYLVSG